MDGRRAAKAPIYVSQPFIKSLWQEYRVYPDRVELDCHLCRTFVVPAEQIAAVGVCRPPVFLDIFRGPFKEFEFWRVLKLDLADLYQHVTIVRREGAFRQLRFTPVDLEEFVAACRSLQRREAPAGAPEVTAS